MNPLRRILHSTALLGLLALSAAVGAQTQGFAQKTKTIRAAVVTLDGDTPSGTTPLPGGGVYRYGQTAAPYAFYNLDQTQGIKPDGWTFINPNAPGAVSQEILEQYAEIYGSTTNANLPNVGDRISKRHGAYWTIRLSQLNDQQAGNYDVLLVAPRYTLSLNAVERERLRRFVDGGGVLWVDLSGAGLLDPSNNLPFALGVAAGATTAPYRDATSPVIDGARLVTDSDLYQLNVGALGTYTTAPVTFDLDNNLPLSGEYYRYRSVAAVGPFGSPQTVISEARLGDGSIVVTARGAAEFLNQPSSNVTAFDRTAPPTSNIGYRAIDPQLSARSRAAARLAVNIVALGGGFRQPGGGARKAGSSAADPGAPVLPRFTAEANYGPGGVVQQGVPVGSPVIQKGFLVATVNDTVSGNYRVVVFDASPGRDLDGDGDEDDGLDDGAGNVQDLWRDTSVGKAMDVVWVSAPSNIALSAPVCAEVPEAGAANADQILVADATGRLHVFLLAPRNGASGRLVGGVHTEAGNVAPPTNGNADYAGRSVNPPTVYDGLAYVADTQSGLPGPGRVWVVNLSNLSVVASANQWYVGGAGVSGVQLPTFTASPTVGYIPIQDSSGGLDRVLYAPGTVNATTQPAFVSLWLGAKAEKPYRIESDGTTVKIVTRAGSNGQLPIYLPGTGVNNVQKQLGIHVTITDANGNPRADKNDYVRGVPTQTAPGELTFTTSHSQADFDAKDVNGNSLVNVRIDYSIDWGADPVNLSGQIVRGRLILPVRKTPSPDPSQRILGPIALTPRGTLHLVESGDSGGTYWAIREDAGRGSFRVVSRFTLYPKYSQSFGASAASYPVPAVFEDADGVQAFLPGANLNEFRNFRFAGGVAVRNGIAYASINAIRGSLGIPVTILAALKAEPETPEIRLGASLGTNPRIAQADFQRSDPNAVIRTPQTSTLAGGQLVVDSENGVIRVENLATVNREEITDSISLSQPIGVGSDGRAYAFRQPEAAGDRWSPLLWFGLWNGGIAKGTPLVAGNEVFVAADTLLISILNTGTINLSNSNGVVWAMDADAPTTGNFAVPIPGRPWMIQQAQIVATSATTIDASPYFRMPQNRGVRNFDDWKLRLNQTALGSSKAAGGVAGGNGIVAAWGDRGLYGMSRADFIVCDEGRLLRVDSSGNPIAKAFGGRFSGIGGGGTAANFRPLVRPVKAYPVGTSDTLVVDSGGNRVVRIDDDGNEQRSIERIALDPNYKPAAYRVNEPLTFKDPRDVATYEGYVRLGETPAMANQGALEYWIRYIVADSGNGRLVELVDRFTADPGTGLIGAPVAANTPDPETGVMRNNVPQVGVLFWQSPSLEGRAKAGDYFNSISRVFVGNIGSGPNPGRYVYVTGVGRARPTRSSAGLDNPNADQRPSGAGGGAIVVFDPQGGTRVFDRFGMPDLTTTPFYNKLTDVFDVNTTANRPSQNDRPFTGLTSVTAATTVQAGVASVRVLASDADAVYEFVIDSSVLADPTMDPTQNPVGGGSLLPQWMINEAAFTALRPQIGTNAKSFRPAYARRLDSGDIVIVNGYRGLTRSGQTEYYGEVVMIDGTLGGATGFTLGKQNLGFSLGSVRFELPPLTGIRGLVSPVFADRR